MSAATIAVWIAMMFGKNDKDYAIAAAWSGFWAWLLWMGGFWS